MVVAIFTGLALSLSGALLAAGANASPGTSASTGAAVSPTVVVSPDRASGHAAERRRALKMPWCGKSWKTGTMKGKQVRTFVKTFRRVVKNGRDIMAAFGVAATVSGIGTLPGLVITVVSKFGGDFIINFVLDKLAKSLKKYKRVGIKFGVKCKWGFAPKPMIGLYGPKR